MKSTPQIAPRLEPRIAIDARMVSEIPHGISRYVSCLADSLQKLQASRKLPYEIVFLVNPELFSKNSTFFGWNVAQIKTPFLHPGEWLEIPRALKANGVDLFHSPSFSSYPSLPCPWISTLHDLNHLHFGSAFQKLYYRLLLKPFAQRARAVATVSEFSRAELIKWLGPIRISIVPNAIERRPPISNETDCTSFLQSLGVQPRQFFFSLTNEKAHKNSQLLARAYRQYAAQTSTPFPLLLTLKPSQLADLPPGPGLIRCIDGLPQEKAQSLLQNCGGLFFPSLYEGFGLPPVEAAVSGAPIAVSEIPPHREGLVDLRPGEALWVNPNDLHGWTTAFHRLAKGEVSPPKADSREKILHRFSLEKLGQKMDQIYRSVLGLGS